MQDWLDAAQDLYDTIEMLDDFTTDGIEMSASYAIDGLFKRAKADHEHPDDF